VSRERTFCRRCQRGFLFEPAESRPDPTICGRTVCYAREHWGPEEWAGRARMARGRLAAGRVLVRQGRDADGNVVMSWSTSNVLDDLDREAISRTGGSVPSRT
jgi:hypothetical protein